MYCFSIKLSNKFVRLWFFGNVILYQLLSTRIKALHSRVLNSRLGYNKYYAFWLYVEHVNSHLYTNNAHHAISGYKLKFPHFVYWEINAPFQLLKRLHWSFGWRNARFYRKLLPNLISSSVALTTQKSECL